MRLRVATFTGSKNISSRRFRILQYINQLSKLDIEVREHYSYFGSWPPVNKLYRPIWLILTILDRIIPIIKSYNCDLIFFQRELVSTLLTLELLTKRPRVLDVDDAIWLQNARANKNFIKLVKNCEAIVCGNEFIYSHLSNYNRNCIVIPTSVDTQRFIPDFSNRNSNKKIIGWSGLSSGFKFLYDIENELNNVLDIHDNVIIRIISDAKPNFRIIPEDKIEYIKWTPNNEVETIQSMTIGIMPIDNSEWSKGKCSYKMLLYMACSIPVVVSNFGMNKEVLDKGDVGFGVNSNTDWVSNICYLLENEVLAIKMGENGRQIIEKYYSLDSNVIVLSNFLKSLKFKI